MTAIDIYASSHEHSEHGEQEARMLPGGSRASASGRTHSICLAYSIVLVSRYRIAVALCCSAIHDESYEVQDLEAGPSAVGRAALGELAMASGTR
jgi:hypothetical protein